MMETEGSPLLMVEAGEEPGSLEAVEERILKRARAEFRADVCTLFPLHPSSGEFNAPRVAGKLEYPEHGQIERPRAHGLARLVLEQGELLVEDLEEEPQYQSPFSQKEHIRAFAAITLKSRSRRKPFAILYIDFRQPQRFDNVQREHLRHFCIKASGLLQNAWLLNRYRQIIHLGEEINQDLDTVENLLQKLNQNILDILDTSYFLMIADYSEQSQTADYYYIYKGKFISDGRLELTPGCRKVIEERHRLVIQNYSQDPQAAALHLLDFDPEDPEEPESLIFLPLLLRGVPVGVLSIQHRDAFAYDHEDLRLLEMIANHLASALSSIHLFRDLKRISKTGQLITGQSSVEEVLAQVRAATEADLVILYPYRQEREAFELPPRAAGTFRVPSVPQPQACWRGYGPYRVLALPEPSFLADAVGAQDLLFAPQSFWPSGFQDREGIASVAAVPLRVGGENVGALYLNFRSPQSFHSRQQHVIRNVAVYTAIAIKNTWQLERHRQELEILQKVDRELSRALPLKGVLQTILNNANEIVGAEHALIMLHNPAVGRLEISSWIGDVPQDTAGGGITRWVFEHGTSLNIPDVKIDPQWKDLYADAYGDTRSELDVLLLDEGEAIGVIGFESPRVGAFTEVDFHFATTLAGQVVLAIKKAQVYDLAERRARERQLLIELSQQIISQLDLQVVLKLILQRAIEATQAAAGSVFLYDDRRKALEMRAYQGTGSHDSELWLTLDQGIVGRVARTREILNVDPTEPPWKDIYFNYAEEKTRSELAVPLVAGDRLWGVLNVESPLPNHLQDSALRLTKALADLAVIALQNAERYQIAEKGRHRLRGLRTVSQAIIRQSDNPDQVMEAIILHALELTGASGAGLDLYSDGLPIKTHRCRTNVAGTTTALDVRDLVEDPTEAPTGIPEYVATTFQPYNTEGEAQDDPHYAGDADIHSQLAVPFIDADTLIGVLYVEHQDLWAFDEADQELLSLFADEAVIAIQNARSHERASRELGRFAALVQAGHQLAELTDPRQLKDACHVVTQQVAEQRLCRAVIRWYDESEDELVLVDSAAQWEADDPLKRMKTTEGVNGAVFHQRITIRIDDTQHLSPGQPQPKLSDPKTRSLLVTPIQLRNLYYGNLSLSHRRPNFFNDTDEKLAKGLAQLLAITYHRLQGIQEQQELLDRTKQWELMTWLFDAAYGLAHRLNNDLGFISTAIDGINEELEPSSRNNETVKRNLEWISSKTKLVLSLADRLIRHEAQGGAQDAPANISAAHLRAMMEEKAASLPSTVHTDIQVASDTAPVLAVSEHVADILGNLISNANDAMGGSGRLQVSARNRDQYVEILVSDNGPGVPPEFREKIFKFLFSLKSDGGGFGLWSSRRKASANGGRLDLVDSPSPGATFRLLLSRADQRLEAQFKE